ncbi:hypothetical protein SAMD00024442_96_3 [Candidatus Symbiothrix dinenymphae]|nr:hypothetical protein SAMD00024442_96_3 [Candidatus Symbiothrix dinenymphae]
MKTTKIFISAMTVLLLSVAGIVFAQDNLEVYRNGGVVFSDVVSSIDSVKFRSGVVAPVNGAPGAKGDKGDTGATGPAGAKGDKGDTGATGPAGAKGDKGDTGATGPAGAKGDKGDTGATGPAGTKGDKGDTGATGPAGAKGDKGDTGATGPAGAKGDKGDIGATGPVGAKGDKGDIGATGPVGAKGDKGDTGATGPVGAKGDKGDTGATGPVGAQGEKGDTGATGPAGAQGEKGDTGATGPVGAQGEKGDTGATGPVGVQGEKGDTGATGPVGVQGEKGDTGATGPVGVQGEKGDTGATGPVGAKGDKGDKGDAGDALFSAIDYSHADYVVFTLADGVTTIKVPKYNTAGDNPPPAGSLTEISSGLSFDMIGVAGGTFTMGATAEQGSDAADHESPTHSVTLSSYAIGKYEVTQKLWWDVKGSWPGTAPSSYGEGDDYPMYNVSHNDIQSFLTALNTKTGKNYRLPTEAEWEYAARGGGESNSYKYSGSDELDDVAWRLDNIPSKSPGTAGYGTQPVGTKAPNELGIYDMSGNLWEWCSDWDGDYSSDSQTNPTGAITGSRRVLRGGSWYDNGGCRVSFRYNFSPNSRAGHIGFRLVLPL